MGNVFIHANEIKKEAGALWIDARYDLMDSTVGKALYAAGHIAGAVHWDLTDQLADMSKEKSGRHPMPEKEQLQQLFETTGLTVEQPIYIYDQGGAPFATRAYWLLRYAGFTNARVIVEGYEGLVAAGFDLSTEMPTPQKTTLTLNWQDALYVDREYVKEVTEGKHNKVLLDARAHARYLGEEEPLDPIAGHIPTARNFDWEQLKNEQGLFLNDKLKDVVSKDEQIIVYCGSGVSATPLFAALTEFGYEHIQLYTGSYSDWVQHYPVAKGEEK